MKFDLHVHTTASDGRDTPSGIIKKAYKIGLDLISITDHDTLNGLKEAGEEAKKYNILFVPGVEITIKCSFYGFDKDYEMHLLGYGFDLNNEELFNKLEEMRAYRFIRGNLILEKLNKKLEHKGFNKISKEEFDKIQKGVESFGRPHIAKLLIDKGIVSTNKEAFTEYLIECDVPKKMLSLKEASSLIHNAGGIVSLAHPWCGKDMPFLKLSSDLKMHKKFLEDMIPWIDGVECYHLEHSADMIENYVELVKSMGLIVTGGTDHHGTKLPDKLGTLNIPSLVAENFLKFMKNKDCFYQKKQSL